MEDILISIDYRDPAWIAIAFGFGLLFKQLKLLPMIGFLVAGFILHLLGVKSGSFLNAFADLGVTLLLFTIGLKLRIGSLLKPEIWASTTFHIIGFIALSVFLLLGLSQLDILSFRHLDFNTAVLIAFALSFSSTVYAVKMLEDRSALTSRFGQLSIGVLVLQDIVAVVFLAASSGKLPSIWAFALIGLIPARYFLYKVLEWSGHKELLTLFGFVLALGGATIFELVGMKGDLGALAVGALIANHCKSKELANNLMGFKDIFLIGFFLTIGLYGLPTLESMATAFILLLLIPFKTILFFKLFTFFRVRSRASTLASLSLSNYSEFGLIVAAIAISAGWLPKEWLTIIALMVSASFVLASPFSIMADNIYASYRHFLKRFESKKRLPGDEDISIYGHSILVFGMGRIGSAAYDEMHDHVDGSILGIDLDECVVERHIKNGRNVITGDASNPEFWSRVQHQESDIHLILLSMPNREANVRAAEQLREHGYKGPLAAITKYGADVERLREAKIDEVYNIYEEAGAGTAKHMQKLLLLPREQTAEQPE
jgi:predicted Kef-type K+ transport protein